MTVSDAAKVLDVSADATPEQLETRFLELRRKLEDKIAKAPTPGLQAKYRESLAEITTAFEMLTLAADGSALPVLQKQAGAKVPSAGAPSAAVSSAAVPAPLPARKTKKTGKEFAIVIVIAILLLGAGGWFVMKTRAENAEKARIAAEAKAEQERVACSITRRPSRPRCRSGRSRRSARSPTSCDLREQREIDFAMLAWELTLKLRDGALPAI